MAGYCGYSMSNNAVDAYNDGEKPLSKWTKRAIIEAIEEAVECEDLQLQCDIEKLKRAKLTFLKRWCLKWSSWHHTSKFYNRTDFYELDIDYLESLTDSDLDEWVCNSKKLQ